MDDNLKREDLDMKTALMQVIQDPEKISSLETFLIDGYKTMSQSTKAFEELFRIVICVLH